MAALLRSPREGRPCYWVPPNRTLILPKTVLHVGIEPKGAGLVPLAAALAGIGLVGVNRILRPTATFLFALGLLPILHVMGRIFCIRTLSTRYRASTSPPFRWAGTTETAPPIIASAG
jgi:hypothetical protein